MPKEKQVTLNEIYSKLVDIEDYITGQVEFPGGKDERDDAEYKPPTRPTTIVPIMTQVYEYGITFLGFDEDGHRDQLKDSFSNHNIDCDPSITAWCAAYADLCRSGAGLEIVDSLAAKDFWQKSFPGHEYIEAENILEDYRIPKGAFLNWRNHISVCAGYANETAYQRYRSRTGTGKITNLDDWREIEDENGELLMSLGGNQSDECNISPKEWYDQYSTFLGICIIN